MSLLRYGAIPFPRMHPMKHHALLAALAALALSPGLAAQNGRPIVQLDSAPSSSGPDGFDNYLEAEGDLWVAAWTDARDPVNTFDDDIFMAVSTDGGKTWGTEFQVSFESVSGFDVDDPYLVVDGGIIYLGYDNDNPSSSTPQAVFMWSSDLGVTWTSTVLSTDGHNPTIAADGGNVAVIWYDDSATPNQLMGVTSSTGPAGIAGPGVAISNPLGDVDADGFGITMDGGVAHVVFVDDPTVIGTDEVYYTSSVAGSGSWSAPLLVSASADADIDPVIAVSGGKVHFCWYSDDVPGAVSTSDDIVHYNSYDLGTLSFGTEQAISPTGAVSADVDYFDMEAEGSNVLIAWSDDTLADELCNVAVSHDGGVSFATTQIPSFGVGPGDTQQHGVAISGDMMYVIYEDDSLLAAAIDEVAAYAYSNDAGATWNGPFQLGTGWQPDEDIDTEKGSWLVEGDRIAGIWQSDGGAALGSGMWFGGVDFPYVTASYDGVGAITFTMVGNPVSEAGDFARWAVSTALGTQIHPENAGLTVGLGASPLWSLTTSFPPKPPLTTPILGDGSATLVKTVGPQTGLTLFVQGWTNTGCASCGTAPGEIFTLVIP